MTVGDFLNAHWGSISDFAVWLALRNVGAAAAEAMARNQ